MNAISTHNRVQTSKTSLQNDQHISNVEINNRITLKESNSHATVNNSTVRGETEEMNSTLQKQQTANSSATVTTKSSCAAPLVYLQTTKAGTISTSAITKSVTSPTLINNSSQFHFSNLNTSSATVPKLIISQPINMSNKPIAVPLIPVSSSKQITRQVVHMQMVKSVKPTSENQQVQIITSGNHLPAGLVPAPTNSKKLLISNMPMPKVTGNRLPVTATSNSDKTKFSFVPIQQPKKQLINFKIADGKLQTDSSESVKIICDTNSLLKKSSNSDSSLMCNEVINTDDYDDAADKTDAAADKTYELSIKDFESPATLTKIKQKLPILKPKPKSLTVVSAANTDDYVFTISIPEKKNESGSFTITIPSAADTRRTFFTSKEGMKEEVTIKKHHVKTNFSAALNKNHDDVAAFATKTGSEPVVVSSVPPKKKPIYANCIEDNRIEIKVPAATTTTKELCYKKSAHGISILKKNHFNFTDSSSSAAHGHAHARPHAPPVDMTNSAHALSGAVKAEPDAPIAAPLDEAAADAAPVAAPPPPKPAPSKGGRRKSNFSYRKDYDEEVVTSAGTTWNDDNATDNFMSSKHFAPPPAVMPKLEPIADGDDDDDLKKCSVLENFVDITRVKTEENCAPLDSASRLMDRDDYDIGKILDWENGIGTLPGSKLRFHYNEFGLLEFISKDEYKKIKEEKRQERLAAEAKRQQQSSPQNEDLRCLECGCYGLPSEFINEHFCSYDCQKEHAAAKKPDPKNRGDGAGGQRGGAHQKKRKKRFAYVKKHMRAGDVTGQKNLLMEDLINQNCMKSNSTGVGSGDDDVSNDGSNVGGAAAANHDSRFSYPWQTGKRGFSWAKYLDHIKAVAAPLKLFKDPFPYSRNSFRPNMKLEGVDPQHPSYFCVLSVAEVLGYRLRLHFDGYPDNYDFWTNADSMDIFPAGWCEKYNHTLQPPPGHDANFNWTNYLKETKANAAPRHLFHNRAGNAICPHGFRLGMKLEAVDRKNSSLVCVATITDLMDNRFLVHFDSWDDIYDYWADPSSPFIHPVGWCDQYGHSLTPPNVGQNSMKFVDYPNPESFTWETYLRDTKSMAAPVRAFKQRAHNGFRRGMRIECVDRRVPQLIRVATVDDVKEHQIRVSFDGWPDRYSYWVDDDSRDIHPVGWCQKTGHPLDPPLTPDDVYDSLECPTVGCRGLGHIKGPKYLVHTTQKFCPYYEENIDLEKILPDRLLAKSPEKLPEAVVPVSREPVLPAMKSKNLLTAGAATAVAAAVNGGGVGGGGNAKSRGRPPKTKHVDQWTPGDPLDDESNGVKRKKRKYNRTRSPSQEKSPPSSPDDPPGEDDGGDDDLDHKPSRRNKMPRNNSGNSDISLNNGYLTQVYNPSRHAWAKHSQYLNEYVSKADSDPRLWNEEEVVEFVQSLPSCKDHGEVFGSNSIDGEAFLMLTQQDLVDILNLKLGPAIKLYNSIVLLRRNVHSVYSSS